MAELQNVDVNQALELAAQGAFLLDVREANEWEAGRSALAIHVPLGEVPDRLDDLPKDRMIVCLCRSGGRSARATAFLMEQGFQAVNLEGGMMAWASEGQPLVADSGTAVIN
jgi:rhodanese-related sulfurtransferase